MSRSGYSDAIDNWALIRWRGMVASAMRGKRGQKMLTDLLAALDAMPVKALIAHELKTEAGEVCALGALGVARGIDMPAIDPDESEEVAAAFDIAEPLAREIVYMNDEYCDSYTVKTPEQRWSAMRNWVATKIKARP